MTTDATPPGSGRRSTPEQDSWMKQYLGLDIDKYEAEAKAKLGEAGTAVADAGKSAVSHVKATAVAAGEGIEEAGKAVADKVEEVAKAAYELIKELRALATELKAEVASLVSSIDHFGDECGSQKMGIGGSALALGGSIATLLGACAVGLTPAAPVALAVAAGAVVGVIGSIATLVSSIEALSECKQAIIDKKKDDKKFDDLKKQVEDLAASKARIQTTVEKIKHVASRASKHPPATIK